MPDVKRTYWEDRLNKDKENLEQLKFGSPDQVLINAAYLGRRSVANNDAQLIFDSVGSVFDDFLDQHNKIKLANKLAKDATIEDFKTYSQSVLDAGTAMGTEAYNVVYDGVDGLKQQYITAVEDEDEKTQALIRSQLNGLSKTLQTMNETITINSETITDEEMLTKGLTDDQVDIIDICKPENLQWDKEKNTLYWEKGDKRYDFEDYDKATQNLTIAHDSIKTIKDETIQVKSDGVGFADGSHGNDFNYNTQHATNKKHINKNNINSLMHDDIFPGAQTFIEALKDHPDLNAPKLLEMFSTDDGKPNYTRIKMFDTNKDNKLSLEDFMPQYFEDNKDVIEYIDDNGGIYYKGNNYDYDFDGVLSHDELKEMLRYNSSLEAKIRESVRDKMISVITNSDDDNYDFDVSRNMLAEYLTLHQRNMFYGGDPDEVMDLQIDMTANQHKTEQEIIDAGGNIGLIKQKYIYVTKDMAEAVKMNLRKISWKNPRNKTVYGAWMTREEYNEYVRGFNTGGVRRGKVRV